MDDTGALFRTSSGLHQYVCDQYVTRRVTRRLTVEGWKAAITLARLYSVGTVREPRDIRHPSERSNSNHR